MSSARPSRRSRSATNDAATDDEPVVQNHDESGDEEDDLGSEGDDDLEEDVYDPSRLTLLLVRAG